jgi:hypothetical protein
MKPFLVLDNNKKSSKILLYLEQRKNKLKVHLSIFSQLLSEYIRQSFDLGILLT